MSAGDTRHMDTKVTTAKGHRDPKPSTSAKKGAPASATPPAAEAAATARVEVSKSKLEPAVRGPTQQNLDETRAGLTKLAARHGLKLGPEYNPQTAATQVVVTQAFRARDPKLASALE